MWKIENDNLVPEITISIEPQDYNLSAISPDHSKIALAGKSSRIVVLDLQTYLSEQMTKVETHKDVAAIFYFDQNLFCVASDGTIREWVNGKWNNRFSSQVTNQSNIISACADASGNVYMGTEKGELFTTSLVNVSPLLSVIKLGNTRVELLLLDITKELLAAACSDKTVHLLDVARIRTQGYQPRIIRNLRGKVRDVTIANNELFVALNDATIVRYDLNMQTLAAKIEAMNSPSASVRP